MKKKRTPAGRPETLRAPVTGDDGLIRLNRYLALNGIASRRRADQLIEEGEVMVDDEIVTEMGLKIDPTKQRVEIDGVVLRPEGERKQYYLLNKPSGVVCTNEERENRPRAIDLISDKRKGRIYTVGRLDEDTVGLVLLTNDGDFAYRLSHPRYGIEKLYRVVVHGRITEDAVAKLKKGVRLPEFRATFDRVKVQKRSEMRSTLLVTLREGKNREIRRVFAKLGFPVRDLRRVEYGCLSERGLKVGHWRPLLREEIAELLELANEENAGPPPAKVRGPRKPGRFGAPGGKGPRRGGSNARSTVRRG